MTDLFAYIGERSHPVIPLGPGKLRAPLSEARAFREAQAAGTEVRYGGRRCLVESVEDGEKPGEVVVRLR